MGGSKIQDLHCRCYQTHHVTEETNGTRRPSGAVHQNHI